MWEQAIRVFRQAAAINREHSLRRGNVVELPPEAELIIAGDLHGHGGNLLRIQALAGDLSAHPRRHVVLQELIHQIPDQEDQPVVESSHHVLARVARWQVQAPGQVHLILGNHALAQMTGQDILKWGTNICEEFLRALRCHYRDETDDVLEAIYDYFRSLPLAARSTDGLAALHSLPAERSLEQFDTTVFSRPIVPADYERSGSVYRLVWGRTFGRPAIDRIKQALNARLLVLGHQPQPTGLLIVESDALIIASDHRHGVALRVGPGPIDSADELARMAVPLASVPLP